MADVSTYPKRPKFFAYRFCRLMAKDCLANQIGPEACWLLAVVAHTEDAKGYRAPVTFFNEQLMPLAGCKSVKSLARLREKAVKAGWLCYVPGTKGVAGQYWVAVPERNRDWDDGPTDESSVYGDAELVGYSVSNSTTKPPENRHKSGEETATKVGKKPPENRHTSGQHSSLALPLALTQRQTDPLTPVVSADEPFDPLRSEQEARKLFERRWNDSGLRKFSRLTHTLHSRLASLLGIAWWAENYPAALERAGKIPWLRDGAGRQRGAYDVGEFLRDEDECRKIIDGVYDEHEKPALKIHQSDPAKDAAIEAFKAAVAAEKAEQKKPA